MAGWSEGSTAGFAADTLLGLNAGSTWTKKSASDVVSVSYWTSKMKSGSAVVGSVVLGSTLGVPIFVTGAAVVSGVTWVTIAWTVEAFTVVSGIEGVTPREVSGVALISGIAIVTCSTVVWKDSNVEYVKHETKHFRLCKRTQNTFSKST